ncbi:hypothetical protein N7516_010225 [Penicillium verrucosum]|uniref:uncharacterized protein n=1 Tax=Penicillium verrucosum TaxID=60171 RepID=UPI002544EE56|nr:uncharacterized protein N7516_010225 [Penicillium verrucosum]KAJ5922522.1 hypothetical protein N7516_010225 [Penicillium verrucosum]
MVFYAYAKNVSNMRDEEEWRYVIVATNMEVLDEWYRTLQERLPAGAIGRPRKDYQSTKVGKETPEFDDRVKFTWLPRVDGRNYVTFYNKHVVDHISGNSFFIRSKSNPSVFWYAENDKIRAGQQGRTRFRITGRDLEGSAVMINGDPISITPVHDWNRSVCVQHNGDLGLGHRSHDFKLADLKNGFLSSGLGFDTKVTKVNHDGEEWELVS